VGQPVGAPTLATIAPHAQCHTGIRCPHQSWRLMFQSRIPSIQSMYTFVQRSGWNCTRPSRTAWIAGAASGFMRQNH
jgi:hypothetical protein